MSENVEKHAGHIPLSRELMADYGLLPETPGKFHLADPARLDFWCAFSIMTDPDSIYRPWRFAVANPLPRFVLFPRAERLAAWTKRTRQEVTYRTKLAADVLRHGHECDY